MLKLENKQKCNSHTCWQWDFVKIMIQQNFPPTVAWQQSRQSTVGDEVEQVFLLRRRWSFNCPPPNNLPQSRHHTANYSEITFTVTAKQFKHPPNETSLKLSNIQINVVKLLNDSRDPVIACVGFDIQIFTPQL